MRMQVMMALWVAAIAAVAFAGAPAAAQEDDEGGDQPWEQDQTPEKKVKEKGKGKAPKPVADEGDDDGAKAGDDTPPVKEQDKEKGKDKDKPAKDEKKPDKKGKGAKKDDDGAAPPQGFKGHVVEETKDYIRCKDDVYAKFLAAREEWSSLKRSQTNLLSLINRDQKVLDQIKGLAEDEIEPDVRTQQVQALTKSIDDAQEKLRKLEPKLHEKLIKYEPLRSKCED